MSDTPEPGLVRVEATTKRPNAVVLNRTTVALTVFTIMLGLGSIAWFVLDARSEVDDARVQSEVNSTVIDAIEEQSAVNGRLIEQGVDCLIALQQQQEGNAERIAAENAAQHGYVPPAVRDGVAIPSELQRQFLEQACPRFFNTQSAMNPDSPP